MKYLDYFQYNSVVILSFFFICLGVMILHAFTKGASTRKFFSTSSNASLLNPLTYVRMFTYVLGHHDWDHFMHNILYILLIGPMVEEKYGSYNLIIMFAITALVGGIWNKLFEKNTRTMGASGIVFMLIVLSSFVNIESGKIPITLVLILLFYVVDEIVKWGSKKDDGISHIGHILGGVCGLIFGFYFK